MTNRVGDLCDISSGSARLFPSVCADDRLEDDVSEAGHLPGDDDDDDDDDNNDEQDDDEDDEEIEEPVALQVESVAHRLVSLLLIKDYFIQVICSRKPWLVIEI